MWNVKYTLNTIFTGYLKWTSNPMRTEGILQNDVDIVLTVPSRPVPSRPVPSRPVPSRTVPHRTAPHRTAVPYRTAPCYVSLSCVINWGIPKKAVPWSKYWANQWDVKQPRRSSQTFCFDVGPASQTLGQHQNNAGLIVYCSLGKPCQSSPTDPQRCINAVPG